MFDLVCDVSVRGTPVTSRNLKCCMESMLKSSFCSGFWNNCRSGADEETNGN